MEAILDFCEDVRVEKLMRWSGSSTKGRWKTRKIELVGQMLGTSQSTRNNALQIATESAVYSAVNPLALRPSSLSRRCEWMSEL